MGRHKKITEDYNETQKQIVCLYLVQILGQPTVKQIQRILCDKMGADWSLVEIKNAVNSAKKRGLLSINHITDPESNDLVDAYSMKDMRWSNPPEVAHIKNVLPELLNDEVTKEIFDDMEGNHTKGEHKGGRLPDIRDYVTYKAVFTNIVPVLGGQPATVSKDDNKLVFRRIADKIWIPGNLWMRSSIRSKLRQYNINESKAMYVFVNDLFFVPKKPTIQIICPSPPAMKGQGGTGLTKLEGLQPGEHLEFNIKFPITGGITEDIMKDLLNNDLRLGAKAKDYGLLQLESFTKI